MFRYKMPIDQQQVSVPEPEYDAGNDIQAWFISIVGGSFEKRIPVATKDVVAWEKDSGDLPSGMAIDSTSGVISGVAEAEEKTESLWHGASASGERIARANIHFSTFQPVGQVTEVNWYTHTGEYFYSQIPTPPGIDVVRWEPLTDNPAGMTTRSGAFDGRPPAAGSFPVAWRGFDYLNREVAFTYGEFLVQDGPVIEEIADQEADKVLGETFDVRPFVKHKIGTISYSLRPVEARPSGLVFAATDGSITGVYDEYETSAKFVIEARDSGSGKTGVSNEFALTTLPEALDLSNLPDLTGVVGQKYQRRIVGGSDNVEFDLVAGQLPSGLTLSTFSKNSRTLGEISGVPKKVETQTGLQISASGQNVAPVTSNPFQFRIASRGLVFKTIPLHARVGQAFQSQPPVVTWGADPPYKYSSITPRPAGLSFDASTGTFSSAGNLPAGSYDQRILMRNFTGFADNNHQIIRVYNDLTLGYPASKVGTRLSRITVSPILTSDSVREPARYTLVQGTLPSFLKLNASTGVISGTPETMDQIGSYGPFVVSLVDGFNQPPVASNAFMIEVEDRPDLELIQKSSKIQRFVYNSPWVVGALNFYDGVTYEITARGNLPPTLSMNSQGLLLGTTTDEVGAVYTFRVKATDGDGYSDEDDISLTVIEPQNIGSIDGSFDKTFTWTVDRDFINFKLPGAYNTYGTVTYTLEDAPFPLQFDPLTLALTGKSPEVGTFTVNYTVEDETARSSVKGKLTFVIQPEMTVSRSDASVNRGAPVTITPDRAYGIAPFKWEISSGSLPATGTFPAMKFDTSTGTISGKAREEGTFPLTLRVTDKTGEQKLVSFNLVVEPPLPLSFSYGEGWMTYDQYSSVVPVVVNKSESIEWTLVSGVLPDGVQLVSSGTAAGAFQGIPLEDGKFENIVVLGKDTGTGQTWTETVTLQVKRWGAVVMGNASLKHRAGTAGTIAFGASNVTEPVTYEIVGDPHPSELSVDSSTGMLTVNFATPGNYSAQVKATDLFKRSKTVTAMFEIVGDVKVTAPALTEVKQYSRASIPLTVENLIGTATYSLDGKSIPLPPELVVQAGEIAGEPVKTETLSGVVVNVTDSYDNMSVTTDPFTIDVGERDALELAVSDYEAKQYADVDFSPAVDHAVGTVQYSIDPQVPQGLNFDPVTGKITGVSDSIFDGVFTITAVDEKGGALGTDSQSFTLKIGERDKPEVTTEASQTAMLGYDYSLTLGYENVLGAVTWRLVSGDLPAGLDFDETAGAFTGNPSEYGEFGPVEIEIIDTYKGIATSNSKLFIVNVVQDGSLIELSIPEEAGFRVDIPFESPVPAAANTVGDVTWSATGLEGTGLAIDSATGVISGTPLSQGETTVVVTVADVTGRTASGEIKLVIKPALEIEFQTENGLTYNYTFEGTTSNPLGTTEPAVAQPEAVNAYGAQVWEIDPAAGLPAGLSFNGSTGKFTGVPLQIGTFGPFTLTLKDSLPGQATLSNVFFDVAMNGDPIALSVSGYTTKIGYPITTAAPSYSNHLGYVTFFPENNDLEGTNLALNPDTGVLTGQFSTPQDRNINIAVSDEFTSRVTSRPLELSVLPLLTLTGPETAVIEAQAPMTPVVVTPGNVAGQIEWQDLDQAQKDLLPDGVSFDVASGGFIGQADDIGVYGPFTVTAVDKFHGFTDTAVSNRISLDVRAGALYMNLAAGALQDGVKRVQAYSHDFMASNLQTVGINETDLNWTWVAEEGSLLPVGLTLGDKTGLLSGTPVESGEFRFLVTVTGGGKTSTAAYALNVGLPQIGLLLAGGALAEAEMGVMYSSDMKDVLTATNIPASEVVWGVDSDVTLGTDEYGGLPPGISINPATGVLSGFASMTGTFRFGISAVWDETNPAVEHADERKEFVLVVGGGGSGYSQVVAGSSHSCAINGSGGVECWGSNASGQLGNGGTANSAFPVQVSGLESGVKSISASYDHTCAVTAGGGVKCWGLGTSGRLGNGGSAVARTPVDVTGLTSGVMSVSAGESHTCVVTTAGGAKCWGLGSNGRLGNSSNSSSSTPVDVTGLTSDVASIGVGRDFSCAVTVTGGARCWGYNAYGRLGNGSTTDRNYPVIPTGLSEGISAISGGSAHACALKTTGEAVCWGYGADGRLGNGKKSNVTTPVTVSGGADYASITVGGGYACATTKDGAAKCWGYNANGRLGDGTTTDRSVPTAVVGLDVNVSNIAAGTHACAIQAGNAFCWGPGTSGQLGNGAFASSETPVMVVAP